MSIKVIATKNWMFNEKPSSRERRVTMKRIQLITALVLFLGAALAPQSFADKGAADELMAALKA